jgi:hypothetical protein
MITIPSASNLEMNTMFNSRDKYSLFKAHVMAWGHVTPSHLGVTRGDHVSRPTLKIMILMINILQNIPLDPPPPPPPPSLMIAQLNPFHYINMVILMMMVQHK